MYRSLTAHYLEPPQAELAVIDVIPFDVTVPQAETAVVDVIGFDVFVPQVGLGVVDVIGFDVEPRVSQFRTSPRPGFIPVMRDGTRITADTRVWLEPTNTFVVGETGTYATATVRKEGFDAVWVWWETVNDSGTTPTMWAPSSGSLYMPSNSTAADINVPLINNPEYGTADEYFSVRVTRAIGESSTAISPDRVVSFVVQDQTYPYYQRVLEDAPYAFWTMGDPEYNVSIDDISGNSRPLTISYNGAYFSYFQSFAQGEIEGVGGHGYASDFVIMDTYGLATRTDSVSGLTSLTASGWIRESPLWDPFNSYNTNDRAIFKLLYSSTTKLRVYVDFTTYSGSTSQGYLRVDATGRSLVSDATVNVLDGEWHHWAVTWTGTTLKVFIDGVRVYNNAAYGAIPTGNGTHTVTVGRFDSKYPIQYDETAIWTSALSDARVEYHYGG